MLSSNQRSTTFVRYVNDMLNVAWFTGFVRKPGNGKFYVQQTNNLDLAVPITVDSSVRLPREYSTVEVTAHVYAEKDPETGLRNAVFKAIRIGPASPLSMPQSVAWNAPRPEGLGEEDFKPFGRDGTLRPELSDGLQESAESIVASVLDATSDRLGANANRVMLAGVLEGAAFIPAKKSERNGYIGLLLRQHKEADRSIPVRIYTNTPQKFLSNVSVGGAIKVIGQGRIKLNLEDPDEPGKPPKIVSRLNYVRADGLLIVDREVDIKGIPAWWPEMVKRRAAEEAERKATARLRAAEVTAQAAKKAEQASVSIEVDHSL